MLGSNLHVTLRLTTFETFVVQWLKCRPKISDLGIPWDTTPKEEETCLGLICTIMQNFTLIDFTLIDDEDICN